jgi:hypothetical protein
MSTLRLPNWIFLKARTRGQLSLCRLYFKLHAHLQSLSQFHSLSTGLQSMYRGFIASGIFEYLLHIV